MSWYYKIEKPYPSLKKIQEEWVKGQKAYDPRENDSKYVEYAFDYTIEEIMPYREYIWTRLTSRDGRLKIENEWKWIPGPIKWDLLRELMKKDQWLDPIKVFIGKDNIKVGEGNHRLAIAQELGKREVPVQFIFVDSVTKSRPLFTKHKLASSLSDLNIFLKDKEDKLRDKTRKYVEDLIGEVEKELSRWS